jgi:hypothetical protein
MFAEWMGSTRPAWAGFKTADEGSAEMMRWHLNNICIGIALHWHCIGIVMLALHCYVLKTLI